ncbi:hypothetical protein HHK36_018408 [Tetracentron sinense]|uniref:Uncharacterized protein n=1 Tax=Tetracentron sinense TaxID=13715 RepID=A0A834Z1G0_TETSI|nr:hypothetical protein HHK36_018408 [Tetracentron sinense]
MVKVPSTSNTPSHVLPLLPLHYTRRIRTDHFAGTDSLLSGTPEAPSSPMVHQAPSEIVDPPLRQSIRIQSKRKVYINDHTSLSLSGDLTGLESTQVSNHLGAMAQQVSASVLQEDRWPLGLQLLNMRVGLVRNRDFSGSISFNTLLTGSPSPSTDSSSDLDTESTGSFFHERSITLGSLIGVSSILETSGRAIRGRRAEALRAKKSYWSKSWFFSLCSKISTDAEIVNNPPSLGHFLEAERRAANGYRVNQSPIICELDEFVPEYPV